MFFFELAVVFHGGCDFFGIAPLEFPSPVKPLLPTRVTHRGLFFFDTQVLGRQQRSEIRAQSITRGIQKIGKYVSKNVIIRRNLHDQSICTSAHLHKIQSSACLPVSLSGHLVAGKGCREGEVVGHISLTTQRYSGTSLLEPGSSALGEDSFTPTSVD